MFACRFGGRAKALYTSDVNGQLTSFLYLFNNALAFFFLLAVIVELGVHMSSSSRTQELASD